MNKNLQKFTGLFSSKFNYLDFLEETATISEEANAFFLKLYGINTNPKFRTIQFEVQEESNTFLFVVFGPNEIFKRYKEYEFDQYLPNYYPIMDDGGGLVFAVDLEAKVWLFDYSDLDESEAIFISDSLQNIIDGTTFLHSFLRL